MQGNTRVIKKYGNRKLYDTVESKYITLLDILGYVKGGDSVQIVNNSTKTDITGEILFNALLEQDRGSEVPVDSLIGIIRGPGSISHYLASFNEKTPIEGGQNG